MRQFLPADYSDAFACEVAGAENFSADDILTEFFTVIPGWVNALVKLRNLLVRPFGLKTDNRNDKIDDFSNMIRNGGTLGFTSVAAKSESETVLLLSDKHLDAYISVYVSRKADIRTVIASTIVHHHNTFGRIYFFFIRPFHKIVVKRMLESTLKRQRA